MTELLKNYGQIILLYSPLGVVGIWRWSIWIFKKILSLRYKPKPINKDFHASLSIVTPVYNEDPTFFLNALHSWKKNKPEEIIAVIDESDKSSIEVFKKFMVTFKNSKLIISDQPGKRPALARGIIEAKSDIIALVDSDTIWGSNIRDGLISPFDDLLVGGVGPRQEVLKADTLARKLFNIYLYNRYQNEFTYLAASGNALTCLSGRTAFYRRQAIVGLVDELINEKFLGKKCISGDDKCLTNLIQKNRWKVIYQANQVVYTPGAPDLRTFFKQELRWTRNSWRADLKTIFSKWIWQEHILHFHLIDRIIQPFALILGPIYFVFSLTRGYWLIALIIVLWWHFSRTVKMFSYFKKNPRDLLILPFYVISVYFMVIIKFYALITINEQGWITRWDKKRLNKNNFFRLIPAYASTGLLILLVAYGNFQFRNLLPLKNKKITPQVEGISQINQSQQSQIVPRDKILKDLNHESFGYYEIQKKDNFSNISQKYNCNLLSLLAANKDIPDQNLIQVGQIIKIPVNELGHNLNKDQSLALPKATIDYDAESNTINLSGVNTRATLSQIQKTLNKKDIIKETSPKEWILRANLYIKKDVTLVLDQDEVSWLKLKSNQNDFIWLIGNQSNILINSTKITSWDEQSNSPDVNIKDGRSFIQAKSSGRMDIFNSELAYLGYQGAPEQGQPFGGVYGVSWRLMPGTFGKHLITGMAVNNKVHDNYFGLYVFGATGMTIKDNEVYDNIIYGIDPHDDSNNLLIENNLVHDNGKHGIIVSKRVFNSKIINNKSYNNHLHGIMLDTQSNNNLIENNQVFNNHDGIALFNSNENYLNKNIIYNNQTGIRANNQSSSNLIENNNIYHNQKGIYLYNDANYNLINNNDINSNETGISLKNVQNNIFQ